MTDKDEQESQEPQVTEFPEELIEIEQYFANRTGTGMWINGPG